MSHKPREQREFFVYHDGVVMHMTGLSCAEDQDGKGADGWWYFPTIRHSVMENYGAFSLASSAYDYGIAQTEAELRKAQNRLANLRSMRTRL